MAKGVKTGGRAKNTPNKATANAREAIARLVDGNTHRLEGWLDQIAKHPDHGPMAAWKCMMDVLEYHIPKLARTDVNVTGEVTLGGVRPDDVEGA
jgi:hypothetical protein